MAELILHDLDSTLMQRLADLAALLLTSDRKLYEAIKAGELAAHIAWVGDLAQ